MLLHSLIKVIDLINGWSLNNFTSQNLLYKLSKRGINMKIKLIPFYFALIISFVIGGCSQEDDKFSIPIEYYKLDNGLRVVLSQDKTAPIVTVAVYYNIGFRIEPKDRTGFAHLFEHMMFQGSENLGKMEFIKLINKTAFTAINLINIRHICSDFHDITLPHQRRHVHPHDFHPVVNCFLTLWSFIGRGFGIMICFCLHTLSAKIIEGWLASALAIAARCC